MCRVDEELSWWVSGCEVEIVIEYKVAGKDKYRVCYQNKLRKVPKVE